MPLLNQPANRQKLYEWIKSQKHLVDPDTFPTFLVLGPQCTASSWLHHNLSMHPEILMPRQKELFFFCEHELTETFERGETPDLHSYMQHFKAPDGRPRPKALGEATASHAWQPVEIIRGITELNPEIKGIILIRNPVHKVWSNFRRKARAEMCYESLGEVGDDVISAFINDRHQIRSALFTEMIENWSKCLKRGNVFVGKFNDVARRPKELLFDLFDFLGVESSPMYITKDAYRKIRVGEEFPLTDRWKSELENIFRQELACLQEQYGVE